ncbi:hypothetical protein [Glycomyces dulcitolivorans]|uniref:hypothetical protein n=1 Tax=Glycomyces dulcitolivorans TaxID=2200759 RepID=UPI000DD40BE0|nr:hypothetical protein [Glycomyces dulcitolivorans]
MNDELPDRLRVTAEEFEPDQGRMWTRISDGMREPRGAAAPAERRRLVPHLALATGAAVVLIGAVVLFGQGLGLGPSADPDPAPPAAGPGSQTEEPSGRDETTGAESTDGGPDETGSGPDETSGETGGDGPGAPDWLHATGGINANNTEYWTQSELAFTSDRDLTGLEVELRLDEGDGLTFVDSWTTDDNLFTEAVVTSEDGYTVMRWTLKDGAVVPAGAEYTLAGQFDPNGGPRSGDGDSFTVTATGEDGETGTLEGAFA